MNANDYAAKAGDIFVLPDAVTRLKTLIDDECTTIDDIAEVINFDPALTAQLLKIANSALYKFPKQIDTINKALQVIGTDSVYDLVIAYGVTKAFNNVDKDVIDLDRFWERSISCALLSKYFAERVSIREPERLFVTGLLHNVGELVILQLAPEKATACAAISENVKPLQLQMEHLGFSYADVGMALIRSWGIPDKIAKPIGRQHHSLVQTHAVEEQVLQLTCIMALENVHQEFYQNHTNLEPMLYERLNLEIEDLENALDFTNLQAMNVLAIMNPGAATIL